MSNFLNNTNISSIVDDIKEIRETQNGRHFLTAVSVGVNKSGQKHICLDFTHTANADNGIKDYLRFSSVDAYLNSINRIKYAFEHLSDEDRPLAKLGLVNPFDVELLPANPGEEPQPKHYKFMAQETWNQCNADITVFQKAKQQWFTDVKTALGEGWELIEDSELSTKTKNSDGKEVADVSYYVACKMVSEKADNMVNALVNFGQTILKKVCILKVTDKSENSSFQNVTGYIESKI